MDEVSVEKDLHMRMRCIGASNVHRGRPCLERLMQVVIDLRSIHVSITLAVQKPASFTL